MSIYWWVIIAYLIWAAAGVYRVISLLGHKNHKDTLLDKMLISSVMPIAYLMGSIHYCRDYFEWAFGKSPIAKYRERNKDNEL